MLHAVDIAMTASGRYFLHMAAFCAIGIGLLYPGLALGNRPLITFAVLLQIPFWLWAVVFIVFFYVISAVVLPLYFYVLLVRPEVEPTANKPHDSQKHDVTLSEE